VFAASGLLTPIPAVGTGPEAGPALTGGDSVPRLWPAPATVDSAIQRDPFRADRRPPPQPYRIGGGEGTRVVHRVVQPVPPFRLHGTVVGASGFAILSLPGVPPRNVSVGQVIEGFSLSRVEQGAATLQRSDTTLILRLDGAGPRGDNP
jgi:hypothetical protein